MGYASPPLSKAQRRRNEEIIQVPAVLDDWLPWFRWHARLAGTGAILGPSRGLPDVGPRVVEALPAAPSLAVPEGGRVRLPPSGSSGVTPPDPGLARRH